MPNDISGMGIGANQQSPTGVPYTQSSLSGTSSPSGGVSGGVNYGAKMDMPGLEQSTSKVNMLGNALDRLIGIFDKFANSQAQMTSGINGVFSAVESGADKANQSISGSGSMGSTLGYNPPPPTNPNAGLTQSFSGGGGGGGGGGLLGNIASLAMIPLRYATNRFEEARMNAYGVASNLSATSIQSNRKIVEVIQSLMDGTPVLGNINDVLGAMQGASTIGYGNLDSGKSGSYFEAIRQMQSLNPGVGAAESGFHLNQQLSNTSSQQRALMFTGGAFSSFGAGGVPKTIQEWSESILKFFEGQRPGEKRGKPFTREELVAQMFPGSNMDAWFSLNGVSDAMRQSFWQYAISKANLTGGSGGSVTMEDLLQNRGPDIAMERLRTATAQGRREFTFLGAGDGGRLNPLGKIMSLGRSNYEQFTNREGNDRKFETMMNMVDLFLAQTIGPFGTIMSMVPSQLQSLMTSAKLDIVPGMLGSMSIPGIGDPGYGVRGNKRKAQIGDTYYGSLGGTGFGGLAPGLADRLAAMMEDNPNLTITSGFRDGALQQRLFDAGVGQVAPGGQSMHGRGWAADLGPESEFGWIAANASRYGLESGAAHGEPWHVGLPGTVPMIGDTPGNTTGSGGKESKGGAINNFVSSIPLVGGIASSGLDLAGSAVGFAGDAMGALGSFASTALGVFRMIGSGFQSLAKIMTGDFSSLFGAGGLFSNIAGGAASGIMKLFGLDFLDPKNKDPMGSFAAAMTTGVGKDGAFTVKQESSVDYSEGISGILNSGASAGGGGGGGGSWGGKVGGPGAGPVLPANVASILQKYNGGQTPGQTDVSKYSQQILAALSAAHNAGFSGDELIAITSIAGRESRWNPQAFNGNAKTGDKSYGLYQINMLGSLGPARRQQFGISSDEQLLDPNVSAQAAFKISNGGTNFSPWGGYKGKNALFNAGQYVQGVYNIAKQAGFVGDPRKPQVTGTPFSVSKSPSSSAPTFLAASGPSYAASVNSPIQMENIFNIQVKGGSVGDAKKLSQMIANEIASSIKPVQDYVKA